MRFSVHTPAPGTSWRALCFDPTRNRHRTVKFKGAFIANEGFTQETAARIVAAGEADAVAFGKLYIANPDLVERFRRNAALNPLVSETIYTSDAAGYNDYPTLESAIN